MRPEGLCQRILPMTLSRIEPKTFWVVVQCLNQLATACLNYEKNGDEILSYVCVCVCVCARARVCVSSVRVLFLSDFSQIVILRQVSVKVQNMKLPKNLSGGIRAASC